MDFFVVFVLCSLATAKVSLQNCFSKKHLITSSDVSFFTAIIFLTAALLFSPNISDTPALVWLFSLIFALFTVLFQLSYTKALAIGNVSLTVMLVNLSMLFPITVSAVFYQEPLHFTRLIGIILTVVSFVLCIELKSKNSISWKWFFLSVFAMLSNAGISITQKVFGSSSFHSEKESFVACSYLLAFFITLIVYGIGKLKKEATTVLKKSSCYLFAILIGVTLSVFQWLNTYAISTIDGTFLFPTYSGGSIILSTLVGILFFKDKFATKMATECMRRDSRMVSSAIHLFIDAWPAGWLKTIVDCERTPKPAFFEYKKALSPILLSLRSDRFTYFDDETVSVETYICNDTNAKVEDCYVVYEAYLGDKMIKRAEIKARFDENTTTYIANAEFNVKVDNRENIILKAFLIKDGAVLSHNSFNVGVFKRRGIERHDGLVIIDDLDAGEHVIAGEVVTVENKSHSYFASRDSDHPSVSEFSEKDFYMLYSEETDMIEHVLTKDFKAKGFTPILLSRGKNSEMMAVGIKEHEGKKYVVSTARLLTENPVMERFVSNLYKL